MNQGYRLLLFVFISISFLHFSHAQWKKVGIEGNDVFILTSNGTDIWAGTQSGGVFRSIDGGDNWTPCNNGLTYLNIRSFLIKDSTLFLGLNGSTGVYRSTDSGAHWTLLSGFPDTSDARCFATMDTMIFVGADDGVFLSKDNGETWENVTHNLPHWVNARCIVFIDSLIFLGSQRGVFVSSDLGLSWTACNNGLTDSWIRCLAVGPAEGGIGTPKLYAGTSHGLFLSSDKGASWTQVPIGTLNPDINSIVLHQAPDGMEILLGTTYGVFFSPDGGINWRGINAGLNSPSFYTLILSGPNLYGGSWDGVWCRPLVDVESTGGEPMNLYPNHLQSYLPQTPIKFVKEVSGKVWVAGDYSLIAWAPSTDISKFYLKNNGIPPTTGITCMDFIDDTTMVAGGDNGAIYKTIDGGNLWSNSFSNPSVVKINTIRFFDAGHGIACGDRTYPLPMAFLETIDSGRTWVNNCDTTLRTGSTSDPVCFVTPSSIFVRGTYDLGEGMYMAGVWESSDLGRHWIFRYVGSATRIDTLSEVNSIDFRDSLHGVLTKTLGSTWTTADGGETWQFLDRYEDVLTRIRYIEGSDTAVATTDLGILYYINTTTKSTGKKNTSTPVSFNSINFVSSTRGYSAGGDPATFYTTFEPPTNVGKISPVPQSLALYQNYPNPFNPTTNISFSIPTQSFISLKVFDILGREFATIVSEIMPAGTYTKQWNAANMSSGIYFYRLQAGKYDETKKLVLIR